MSEQPPSDKKTSPQKQEVSLFHNNTADNLSDRVQVFLDEHFDTMKKAHFKHRNTICYHQCCNAFTSKKHESRRGHTKSITLYQFLGKRSHEADMDSALQACCKASQDISGVMQYSTPTYNTHHQDLRSANNKVNYAEQLTSIWHLSSADRYQLLMHEIDYMRNKISRLKQQLKLETKRADDSERDCLIYVAFLRHNNISAKSVRDGWCPPPDHKVKPQVIKWPNCFDKLAVNRAEEQEQ